MISRIYQDKNQIQYRVYGTTHALGQTWNLLLLEKYFVKTVCIFTLISRNFFWKGTYESNMMHSVEIAEILSNWKKISSNQLFSNFFSKTVDFTRFLPSEISSYTHLQKFRERNVSTALALKKLLDSWFDGIFLFVRGVNFSVFHIVTVDHISCKHILLTNNVMKSRCSIGFK